MHKIKIDNKMKIHNKNKLLVLLAFSLLLTLTSQVGLAHEQQGRADSHAPIGVMGDHMHKRGEFMISYRHMQMSMSGNREGSSEISDDEIATVIPNAFFGMTGMPPTLRIVPQEMDSTMDMFGVMYAPTDKVTLMLMLNYLSKDMRLKTYSGGMGTDVRGFFDTNTSGLGDTKLAALISLYRDSVHRLHANVGLSLPTGAIDERGEVLPPMSMGEDMMSGMPMLMEMRLPYAMQLGSGTYDFEPGLTYYGLGERFSWGAQYRAILRTGENDESYKLGNEHKAQAWTQFLFKPALSASLRLEYKSLDRIDGQDPNIMGPVQTADPHNYGGDYLSAAFGFNYYGQKGLLKKHRLAAEYSLPVVQDVNGVQMSMDHMFTLGYQYAF